jgi:hypothetical protein
MRQRTEARPAVTRQKKFPAPFRGWVQSGNITTAPPDQAERLDNFFPTAQGAELRAGASEYADMGAASVRLWNHVAGAVESMFGSTATAIFDIDRLNGGSNAWAEVESLTSGDWVAVQQSTSGGVFSVWVNGSDYALYYDGSDINPIAAEAINDLDFDAETAAFTVGQTVTGGTSGATATIYAVTKSSATAGKLKVGAITGTFQDDEAITDGATGSATSNIPSGTSSASSVTMTGKATNTLSQGWLFKERLFFVEGGTQSAWYLPVESIGGALTEFSLGSVFRKGGNLLFGAAWSLDSGAGLDDVCIFVSTQGEIAVYEGSDPSNASTWGLVGVYDIAPPVDKHGHFKAGGDLAILTDDGIIPVSEALRKDRGALQASAITYPIEDAWREVVAQRSGSDPVTATLWQSQTMLLVGTPGKFEGLDVCFVANARTGAWGRYLGWDVQCSTVSADQLYFGTSAGKVLKAEDGGQDDGVSFKGVYVPKFSECGVAAWKNATHTTLTYRASEQLNIRIDAHSDYNIGTLTAPDASPVTSGDVWGTGVWGTFVWGGASQTQTYTIHQAVAAGGYSLAPSLQIVSNEATKLNFKILGVTLRYEVGDAL